MTATTDMHPTLDALSEQAEAIAASPVEPEPGRDELPTHQQAAWRRVLTGFMSGEGVEEDLIGPLTDGLVAAGFDDAAVLRFYRAQGADELRHRDMFAAYLERQWGEPPRANDTLAHKLFYEGLFKAYFKRCASRPLRLMLPLLFYERAGGTLYVARLLRCVPEGAPRLEALLKAVHRDEARHVAGVGMTVRALVARQRPDAAERRLIMRFCWLVHQDMDRTAWWKPGLRDRMRALGIDTDAMRRDNDAILAEMGAILEGRA